MRFILLLALTSCGFAQDLDAPRTGVPSVDAVRSAGYMAITARFGAFFDWVLTSQSSAEAQQRMREWVPDWREFDECLTAEEQVAFMLQLSHWQQRQISAGLN